MTIMHNNDLNVFSPSHSAVFWSLKDKDFCFWFSKKNLPNSVPKDQEFCISKTVYEIHNAYFQTLSLKTRE